ncbi:MAG: CRISPR-associated protein Csx20 [Microscillaceae bacterium]|nr:CRISPR-associated protein Csx20 [Microscillaceae bacterium]
MLTLHLLFSHSLIPDQIEDAKSKLQITGFQALPIDLQKHFSHVPPDLEDLTEYVQPLKDWLLQHTKSGDFVLIHGDFGLVCHLANFCKQNALIPIYATTERKSIEIPQEDGSIVTQRIFKHTLFRKY